jgi:hypothetical protein
VKTFKKYKLRAECLLDTAGPIEKLAKECGFEIVWTIHSIPRFPDCEMNIACKLSLDELKAIIATVEDGHIMLETVVPKDEYTGERN